MLALVYLLSVRPQVARRQSGAAPPPPYPGPPPTGGRGLAMTPTSEPSERMAARTTGRRHLHLRRLDPQGHVAIDSSGMLMDATGEPATKVGDSFVVHMDRGSLNDYPLGLYDVTVSITRFEKIA